MCKHTKHGDTRIDPCMRNIVKFINKNTIYKTIMCCCGHNKYPPSIIAINTHEAEWCNTPYELFSRFQFKHNQKRFYKRDSDGVYYIPKVVNDKKN